ncbi:hypothetical protein PV797_04495 [Clostridiaceae bacterium M8S5]|nr:hypothetical protein PV797_04495 [Clostridiaceae bacterium M8S5]
MKNEENIKVKYYHGKINVVDENDSLIVAVIIMMNIKKLVVNMVNKDKI